MQETLEFLSITARILLPPEDPRFFPTTPTERGEDDRPKKPQHHAILDEDHVFVARWWPCALDTDD